MQTSNSRCFLVLCTANSLSSNRQPLRLCSQYFKHPKSNSKTQLKQSEQRWENEMECQLPQREGKQKILEMFVYTSTDVYFGVATMSNFNRELSWNQRYEELLRNSLSGRNSNVVIEFQIAKLKLRVYSEFNQNSIRILLLQLDVVCLHKHPFKHSQQLAKTISGCQLQRLTHLQANNHMQQNTMEKLDAMHKEVIQQYDFDMNIAKDRFLTVINQAKMKLRPHFGIIEKKIEGENSGSQTRTFFRIKSMQDSKRQSDNLYNLFD